MHTVNLTQTVMAIHSLPDYAQQQVADFVDFLKSKYTPASYPLEKAQIYAQTDNDSIESIFGLIKAKTSVSLEEMQEGIEIAGSKL